MFSKCRVLNPSLPARVSRCFSSLSWVSSIYCTVLHKKPGILNDFVFNLPDTWLYCLPTRSSIHLADILRPWLYHLLARSGIHLADIFGPWREQSVAELWLFMFSLLEVREPEERDFIMTHRVRRRS